MQHVQHVPVAAQHHGNVRVLDWHELPAFTQQLSGFLRARGVRREQGKALRLGHRKVHMGHGPVWQCRNTFAGTLC